MEFTAKKLVRLIVFIILVAVIAIVAIHYRAQLNPVSIKATINHFGIWAPIIFILIYAIGTVCFLPGAILTLSGGLLFGPVWGTIYNLTGAVIGATGAFIIARYFAGEWVSRKTGNKLKPLMHGIANEGWRFVAVTRLIPIIPFNLLNYALGLTRIRLSHYIIASTIFMLPGCFAYTYLGYVGAAAAEGSKGLVQKILIAVSLLIIVGLLPSIVKALHKNK